MKTKLLILLAILALCLSSCAVTEKITMKTDSTGRSHVDIMVDDFFVGVVEDLSSWQDKGNTDPIMDVAVKDFETNLKKSSSASSVNFIIAGKNTYLGDFSFVNLERLLEDLSNGQTEQNLVVLSEVNGQNRLDININFDNYGTLEKIVPFLADPNFEVYGPRYNQEMTAPDYLDMISFILGEDGPESINNSVIKLQFVAPSQILEHNGTLKNAKTVEFSFPLIDFLLLHEGITFYCTW